MLFHITTFVTLLGLISPSGANRTPKRDYDARNYFLIEINTNDSNKPLLDFISTHNDYKFEHQLTGMDNYYVFSIDKQHTHNQFLGNLNSNPHSIMKRAEGFEDVYDSLVENSALRSIHLLPPKKLERRAPVQITSDPSLFNSKRLDIVDSSQEPLKKVSDDLDIQDPIFAQQWHLINTLFPGNDVNVSGLWYEGITGKGIVSAIVDDGLDYENSDLTENFNSQGSWDYNDNTELPLPRLFDDYHGTRCAGEIAAVKNDVCGVGVAYGSQVSGIRILSGAITGADEASALVYGLDVNDIYSCSWGPTDDGRTLSEPEVVVKKAFVKGVQDGRKDKGSVYVFASGNGGRSSDSCNFDGYTNSIYSITVGAIDYKGLHPNYAEACSAVMVVTYSSGSGEHIHTTDVHKRCSAQHGGTSAAAPLAAGIYSLILQSNPNLTWRDVQYVSVLSSTPVNEDDGHYQVTALGRKYSHKYGYGKMDAYEMAHFAKDWKNVKPQSWYYSDVQEVQENITIGSGGKQSIFKTLLVSRAELDFMNVERIEHVTVVVNIKSTFRGRVGVRLVSPTGIHSDLATFRPGDTSGSGFVNWTFMSVAHWGEQGHGAWRIEVFGDRSIKDATEIVFENWQLRFFGEAIDADKAEKFDIDIDYAAQRRDRLAQQTPPEPTTTEEKPSPTSQPQQEEEEEEEEEETTPANPTEGSESDENEIEEGDLGKGYNKTPSTDHTGQYFIGLAIVGFVVVLALMKFHKSPGSGRRRRRRDEYEFDIIPGEDYSDSEEDEEDEDSFDLGRGGGRRTGRGEQPYANIPDGLPDGLPEYEEEMFRIDDEDDTKYKEPVVDQKVAVPNQEGSSQDTTKPQERQAHSAEQPVDNVEQEDTRLEGSSS